ncbi:hypothetical protein GE09DRAFT_964855 [Coniochaeta sp. 2T2.1]|nr:hypothetical protein GE09DRAFT_964855 [Coniochaeta sp. 2T2.1]
MDPNVDAALHDQPTGTHQSASASKPIRRRMRMITSCLECRRRKLKCNKSQPCTNCVRFNRDCVYLGPKLDEASQLRLTEIKEKVGSLERQLERDVAKSTTKAAAQQRILADDVEGDFDEERDLEITPMVALDLTYEDDADGTDDIIDLGIQVGRMRITERIGGLNRPRLSEEVCTTGLSGNPASPPPQQRPGPDPRPSPGFDSMSDVAPSEVSIPEFLRPGASYIAPSGGFFFGQVGQMPDFINFLPSKDLGHRLLQRYWDAVHPVARCVHRRSFETQYVSFWQNIDNGYEPPAPQQALVFAAWFTAAVSLDEGRAHAEYGFEKQYLIDHMKIGTECALGKANFLRTTRVDTMQAFIMYLIPLCRAEVSRAHSVLVGAAVRMAECMGLHRDGEAYGLSPLETHVRRLLWHQLCFLDIRTCEAQGPKPAIRREDYDTKLPLNCEEEQLTPQATVSPDSAEQWTSTLLILIRFEINEMMRIIWSDRRKLETRKTTLTAVLTKIENFRKRMFEKYEPFLSDEIPIQRYAKLVMHLLVYRLHAMVLHPYHSNAANPMPQRLNSVLVMSGIMIIEISIQLETDPQFARWTWYIGAYQQFQIALLLATEIYYRPDNKEADRIWSCLDYVFNLAPEMPREQKAGAILTEIMGKTAVYTGMRKMRAPTGIAKAVPEKVAVKSETPSPAPRAVPPPYMDQQAQMAAQQQMGMSGFKTEPMSGVSSPIRMMSSQGSSQHGMQMGGGQQPHQQQMPMHNMQAGMHQQQQQQQQPPPPPNMVWAGVSNGEVLWSLPPGNPGSPDSNSSDGGSVAGYQQKHRQPGMAGMPQPGVMENIDWVCSFFTSPFLVIRLI